MSSFLYKTINVIWYFQCVKSRALWKSVTIKKWSNDLKKEAAKSIQIVKQKEMTIFLNFKAI